jgi:cell division protein FtsB
MRLQQHRIARDQATIAEGAAERDRLRTRISNLESQLQAVADGVDPGFILNQIR